MNAKNVPAVDAQDDPSPLSRVVLAVRRYFPAIACMALLAIMLLAFQIVGVSNRRFADGHRHYKVGSSRDGYLLLRRLGLRGRIVVLFDKTAHLQQWGALEYIRSLRGSDESAPVTPDNFAEGFILSGIARQFYVVVPEKEWPLIVLHMSTRGDGIVTSSSVSSRLYGARVDYVTLENLPRFGERVVAYVPETAESGYPSSFLTSFDDPKVSDVYVVQEGR